MKKFSRFLNFKSGFSYLESIISLFVISILSISGIFYLKVFKSELNKNMQDLHFELAKYEFEKKLETQVQKISFDYWENEKMFLSKLNEINKIVKYEILKNKKNQIFAVKFFYFNKNELREYIVYLKNFNLGKTKWN